MTMQQAPDPAVIEQIRRLRDLDRSRFSALAGAVDGVAHIKAATDPKIKDLLQARNAAKQAAEDATAAKTKADKALIAAQAALAAAVEPDLPADYRQAEATK